MEIGGAFRCTVCMGLSLSHRQLFDYHLDSQCRGVFWDRVTELKAPYCIRGVMVNVIRYYSSNKIAS